MSEHVFYIPETNSIETLTEIGLVALSFLDKEGYLGVTALIRGDIESEKIIYLGEL